MNHDRGGKGKQAGGNRQWERPAIRRTLSDAEVEQELKGLDPRLYGGTGTFINGTFRNSVKSDA